ncbi:probable BOI-related E3 ubiquitin-protein ligase 3 [Gastrolobium bilobum]|uniref:probable BOI-related E3 ubiquitin-protein ligase 3 n=1 Tax=Gastrolobium bilobum TaxID=150636 RepID=UPI002AB1428C|nr:probable BOI-related E3 ubiquitin-protein ligase 3 [Gastrolobium bilobum]
MAIGSAYVFSLQHQHPGDQRLYNNESQMNQNMSVIGPSLLLSNSNPYIATNKLYNNSLLYSQSLDLELHKQRDEIDQYITSHNEKLRTMMQEHRMQQVAALLKKMESQALCVLIQKDEQIAHAAKKMTELEDFVRRLEAENQSWQRVAQEKEATVLSLHNTLEQIKERDFCYFNNGVAAAEDVESCCDESGRNMALEEETGESRVFNGGVIREAEQIRRKTMVCKCCNSRSSCCLFLPCRHLCSCKACEAFLQACPVCRMPKKSSIETLNF